MKILILTNSIGGILHFRIELMEALCKRGDEVYISSIIETSPERLEALGCKIIPMEMEQRGTNPISEFKLIGKYKRLLQSVQPDIVLAYTIKPNIYGSLACRSLHIPIICSITGLGVALENGGFLAKISIALLRFSMKTTDFVYFQNQESIDFFQKHGIRPLGESIISGSGVNLERFQQKEYPAEGEIHFLFISRILEKKGIGLYLDAAEELIKKYPNTSYHIVGIKDDPKFDARIEKLHNEGVIVYHGEQKDVRPFIADAHCLVHPSYYPEGMSNVLLESAATGRPAITTDKAGCREIVDHEVTGYIVRQADGNDLKEKMERFINLPYSEKKVLGEHACQKVHREFDRKKVIQTYINKIDELVKM